MRVVLQDAEVSVPNGDPERMATAVPVSVVIPTFTRQVVLAETLMSLRQCKPAPSETLVLVDHGDDQTRAALEPYFPEVVWTEAKSRLGPGGARNILLALARCPYVASFDDDSHPIDVDYFTKVFALFEAHPRAAVIAAGVIVHDGDRALPVTQTIAPVCDFVGCGAAFRKTAFLETKGYLPLERAYGAEEVDVALQVLGKGWLILEAGALRVRHKTSRNNQATPEVTSAHISNTALVGYLRYPAQLWAVVVLQVGRRFYWSLRNGRSAGALRGLAGIPANLWRHRSHRAPVRARVICAALALRRRAK